MVEESTKLPVGGPSRETRPIESLQQAINRMFDDFGSGFFRAPFGMRSTDSDLFGGVGALPAADVAEHDTEYEITMELPGTEASDVDVKLANGTLTITGEKKQEKEEKKKDYYLSERRFGSFRRAFRVPEGVDTSAVEADFNKGVLTVRLPKTAEAQRSEKKIDIKSD